MPWSRIWRVTWRGQPVQARAPSYGYVLGKFVRRNRVAVVAAVLVGVSLVAGLAGTVWQARQAAEQAARARQSKDFLVDLFAAVDPGVARGRTMTAEDILERGRRRLATELVNQPRLRSELLLTVGDLLARVGAEARAETVLTEALVRTERRVRVRHGRGRAGARRARRRALRPGPPRRGRSDLSARVRYPRDRHGAATR